ncbi:chromosome segregation protein SMC [Tepidibacillus fermentans]|uniref:Chromosome partition protein Smc n=1 Tax=Tepidibacillus fermentans TaxID=1281767 RepID=A0A4R3K8L2_9BACI|nr:chromosome segregation protein SMC [Tepidibacillus fermentans]TCS79219.1 condensin subunit Smc [Tepidibacillus fermentans]
MYLKSIELFGFKSFADRTELEFVPGITAVVGPNGSGKSNITDAIRWVLGEQSAKTLRGTKMEDIIFAGSDTRKPVNYSEVSITLNNMDRSLKVDFSEVTVTRRVYRSGESEYFINKQPCRLKDITDLFMDTGLGREAFSIIGQGRIEEIITSKPEERRGIFEEAAGIVKYKTRKKEAQKKIKETEQNLLRIDDLIIELEDQLEPLENQATVAKQYKELTEKLKEKNIQVYVHDITKLHQEWQETEVLKKQIAKDHLELSSKLSQFNAIIEEKRWLAGQMEKEIEELHQRLLQVSEEVEKTEGKREVLRERSKNQKILQTQTMQNIKNLQIKKMEILTQLQAQQQRLEEVNREIERFNQSLLHEQESLKQILNNHHEQVELLKEDYFELLNLMASLRNELRHLQSTKDSLQYRLEKLQSELHLLEKEDVQALNKKENAEKEIDFVTKEIERLRQEYQETIHHQRTVAEQLATQQKEIQQFQQKLESLRSRKEVLMEMQADFAGFQHGVREILKLREKGQMNGIHGAIAELLHVPQKYENAIEVVLGAALQFIVVDHESTGRKAINYLKEKKLGRATFLPLNVMKGKRINLSDIKKLESVKGFIGVAVDLIQTESQYESIMEYLLGQIVVASDLKTAGEIARMMNYHYRVVTLDGDVVNTGGSMTGGSIQKKNANLLSRQREIEELETQIKTIQQDLSKNIVLLEKIKLEGQSIQDKLESIRSDGEQYRIKEQELKTKWSQYSYELKNIDDRKNILLQEIEDAKTEWNQLVMKEEQMKQDLEAHSQQEKELKQKIEIAESIRQQDESTKDEANQKITQLKIELARLQQQRDGTIHLVERLQADHYEVIQSIEQNQQILIDLEEGLIHDQEQEDLMTQAIQQLRTHKEENQKILNDKRKNRVKALQEIESEEIQSKEIRKQLKIVENQLHQVEVKLSRLDVGLENLLSQLAMEYEMSYEWAKDHIPHVKNIDQVKIEVKELKDKLQRLGEVNLGAIEEFERISERYRFLTSQKQDLVEAKQTLYQVIAEMDQEMNKRFKEHFDSIREQFQIIFAKLFGGGRADLLLTDPNNLLETGIEIVAQPPGKKLQNLALLSGGEKALTAITLLFAILQIKPVPFCVLDEVEAALDEVNVTRFAQYLREYSNDTQFIIVTHRKGTMEEADVLYGVTMQESGVSRLVSVKMEEKVEEMQPA